MRSFFPLPAAVAVLLAALSGTADAAPGDVVIPAHRTRDGTLVPANVPPSSGGTAMPVVAPGRPARAQRPVSRGRPAAAPVPLFVDARPLRH